MFSTLIDLISLYKYYKTVHKDQFKISYKRNALKLRLLNNGNYTEVLSAEVESAFPGSVILENL